jgi:hypothetical protein
MPEYPPSDKRARHRICPGAKINEQLAAGSLKVAEREGFDLCVDSGSPSTSIVRFDNWLGNA